MAKRGPVVTQVDFEGANTALASGQSLEKGLEPLGERRRDPIAGLLVEILLVHVKHGGRVKTVLDRLAAAARRRANVRRRILRLPFGCAQGRRSGQVPGRAGPTAVGSAYRQHRSFRHAGHLSSLGPRAGHAFLRDHCGRDHRPGGRPDQHRVLHPGHAGGQPSAADRGVGLRRIGVWHSRWSIRVFVASPRRLRSGGWKGWP